MGRELGHVSFHPLDTKMFRTSDAWKRFEKYFLDLRNILKSRKYQRTFSKQENLSG